jgi:hypothetical protein
MVGIENIIDQVIDLFFRDRPRALWSRGFARENRTPDQHDAWSVAAWLRNADLDGSLVGFLKGASCSSNLPLFPDFVPILVSTGHGRSGWVIKQPQGNRSA